MPAYTLTVNGEPRQFEAAADTPLLWVLRDVLSLTGTKYGCGAGLCRACTVHLDGEASFSCQIPISAADGRNITTIEGLSPDRSHPLQQAWIEEDVPQCGYCQPGQIMSAAALLARTPAPATRRSTPPWRRTSAAAGPTTASAARSTAREEEGANTAAAYASPEVAHHG